MKTLVRRFGTLSFAFALLLASAALAADRGSSAANIASLIDPAKLATLRERGANPRVQKYVALLEDARAAGEKPDVVAAAAVKIVGMRGSAAKLTARQMVRNLKLAGDYGCLDAEGLARMRRGQAPVIMRGGSKRDELSVDHIIPRQVVPELDNVIANLELMPQRLNESKNARIGKQQLDLGRKLRKAHLLSASGLRAIEERSARAEH